MIKACDIHEETQKSDIIQSILFECDAIIRDAARSGRFFVHIKEHLDYAEELRIIYAGRGFDVMVIPKSRRSFKPGYISIHWKNIKK